MNVFNTIQTGINAALSYGFRTTRHLPFVNQIIEAAIPVFRDLTDINTTIGRLIIFGLPVAPLTFMSNSTDFIVHLAPVYCVYYGIFIAELHDDSDRAFNPHPPAATETQTINAPFKESLEETLATARTHAPAPAA